MYPAGVRICVMMGKGLSQLQLLMIATWFTQPVEPSFCSSSPPSHLVVVNTHDKQKATGHAQQHILQIDSCLGVAQWGAAGMGITVSIDWDWFGPIWARRRLSSSNPSGIVAMHVVQSILFLATSLQSVDRMIIVVFSSCRECQAWSRVLSAVSDKLTSSKDAGLKTCMGVRVEMTTSL